MDTVDTLEGLRRTVGVGREAHPGDAGPVGGRFPPGDNVTKRSKKATKTEKRRKRDLKGFKCMTVRFFNCKTLTEF